MATHTTAYPRRTPRATRTPAFALYPDRQLLLPQQSAPTQGDLLVLPPLASNAPWPTFQLTSQTCASLGQGAAFMSTPRIDDAVLLPAAHAPASLISAPDIIDPFLPHPSSASLDLCPPAADHLLIYLGYTEKKLPPPPRSPNIAIVYAPEDRSAKPRQTSLASLAQLKAKPILPKAPPAPIQYAPEDANARTPHPAPSRNPAVSSSSNKLLSPKSLSFSALILGLISFALVVLSFPYIRVLQTSYTNYLIVSLCLGFVSTFLVLKPKQAQHNEMQRAKIGLILLIAALVLEIGAQLILRLIGSPSPSISLLRLS